MRVKILYNFCMCKDGSGWRIVERKYFSVGEANSLLPFIESRLQALQQLKREVYGKRRRLHQLKVAVFHEEDKRKAQSDTMFTIECELEFAQIEAKSHLKAIHTTGAELKDIDSGLVDFPALWHDEEVLLCWKQGEEQIMHYHSAADGFGGRKPID